MAKRSSYRLSGRLNASRRSRLAFLTYLNSGGDNKVDGNIAVPAMLFAERGANGSVGYSSFVDDKYGDLTGPNPLPSNPMLALIKLPGGGDYVVFDGNAVTNLSGKELKLGEESLVIATADTLAYNPGQGRTQVFFADNGLSIVENTSYPISIAQIPALEVGLSIEGGGSVAINPTAVALTIQPHRAWRVKVLAQNGGNLFDTREIEFIDAAGVRQRTGGTAFSSSGTDSANGFDVDYNSFASVDNGGTGPQWVGYDFGAGNEKDIRLLKLWTGVTKGRCPRDMDIEYSDDMATWTIAKSYRNIPDNQWENFGSHSLDFPLYDPVPYRYWRLRFKEGSYGGFVEAREIEFRETSGGPVVGGTPLETYMANAFDGNTETIWQSGNYNFYPIGLDLGTAKVINQVTYTNSGNGNYAPRSFIVEGSDDKLLWVGQWMTPAISYDGNFVTVSSRSNTQPPVEPALIAANVDGGGSVAAAPIVGKVFGINIQGDGSVGVAPIKGKLFGINIEGGGQVTTAVIKEIAIRPNIDGGGSVDVTVTAIANNYTPVNSEAGTVYTAMTASQTNNRKKAIDDCIGALKTGGVWAKLSGLYVFHANDAQAARVNWKTPANVASIRGAPVFAANDSYRSGGGDNGLLSGIVPSTDALMLQNDMSLGIYSVDQLAVDDFFDIGTNLGGSNVGPLAMQVRRTDNTCRGFAFSATAFNVTPSYGTGGALSCVTRTGAAITEIWLNSTKQGATSTAASGTRSTVQLGLLASWNNTLLSGANRKQKTAFFGAALTAAQQTTLKTALEAYYVAAA